MSKVSIIAIDRAEPELARACKKFAESHQDLQIKTFLLVNEGFKDSPAYHGNETEGYFEEINCDFNDTEELKRIIARISSEKVVFHCRMEEAIKDFEKVIPLVPNALNPSTESLVLSTEKVKMRGSISAKYPEICPKFVEIDDFSSFSEDLIKDFAYPVIVKPNGLHSSFFVTRCDNISELRKCLEVTFKNLGKVYDREYGTGQPCLLIEEFMTGEMYSIDAYTDADGDTTCLPLVRVITAAELGLDGYYSYRHIVPTNLSEQEAIDADVCATKAIDAIGIKSSTTHIELYKTADGWKIIEIGPRIGGYRQGLYMEAFGIDHYYNDLLIHFGEPPVVTQQWHRHAAGINIYAETEGVITAIEGFEAASKLGSVVFLKLNAKVGDTALFASEGGQYIVDGILSNDDKETLEQDVKSVRDMIKIVIG